MTIHDQLEEILGLADVLQEFIGADASDGEPGHGSNLVGWVKEVGRDLEVAIVRLRQTLEAGHAARSDQANSTPLQPPRMQHGEAVRFTGGWRPDDLGAGKRVDSRW